MMFDPYSMIVVNVILSLLLLVGMLSFRFIYPKKTIKLFILFMLISFLPTISIFRNGVYESGDFNIHIYRSIAFFESLQEGNIMPSWVKDLNATYGYPLFIFNYTFPYYIISFFHFLGFSFIGSMKLFLAANVILSGFFMFLFVKSILKNTFSAFFASIFYVFAPYHLIDIHFKVVIGEILFFTLLPLSLLFTHKLCHKKSLLYFLLASLFVAALILSHAIIAFFAIVILLAYIFFLSYQDRFRKIPLLNILALLFSLLISIYAWLGPILLSKYSFIQKINLKSAYFPTLSDLLFSPWRMGFLFQGPYGEISHLIGYAHIFIILAIAVLITRKKIPKNINKSVVFWYILFFIFLFLVLPYSKPLWESLPAIKVIGSHRLLILTTFIVSLLAGYFSVIVKKRWLLNFVIIVAIVSTILNWGHRRVIVGITDEILRKNLWKSTSQGEGHFYANTRWADINTPWFSEKPNKNIDILKGEGEIKTIYKTSTLHSYKISAKTPLTILENTLYFPGWEAKINGEKIPIFPSKNGIIAFSAPLGNYNLDIVYQDISIYRWLKRVSLVSFIVVLTAIIGIVVTKRYGTRHYFII